MNKIEAVLKFLSDKHASVSIYDPTMTFVTYPYPNKRLQAYRCSASFDSLLGGKDPVEFVGYGGSYQEAIESLG